MRRQVLSLAAAVSSAPMISSFAPAARPRTSSPRPTTTSSKLDMAVDPSSLVHHFLLSAIDDTAFAAADAAAGAVAESPAAADGGNGWFGFLTLPIEYTLRAIHGALATSAIGTNAWGVSIIVMTVAIKAATYPLTRSQLESTNKMQVRKINYTCIYIYTRLCSRGIILLWIDTVYKLYIFVLFSPTLIIIIIIIIKHASIIIREQNKALQPTIKSLQAKYQSNPEVMNQKIAEVYQRNEVNPLAGCIPSLVQIPVFIGLYRAVLNLAKENALDESFLFLPSLEGPTYGADPAHGSDWLFKNW